MTLLPLTRTEPADDVAEALRNEVLGGSYPPGQRGRRRRGPGAPGRLRATSRGPRWRRLEREGLLVHSLHRGLEVVRLSVEDVRDLYATRRTLELAGLEAMVRRRPADDVWLQAAVQSMTEAAKAGDSRAAVAADAAFHLAIVATTSSRAPADRRPGRAARAADRARRRRPRRFRPRRSRRRPRRPARRARQRPAAVGAGRAARPPAPRRVARAGGHPRRLSAALGRARVVSCPPLSGHASSQPRARSVQRLSARRRAVAADAAIAGRRGLARAAGRTPRATSSPSRRPGLPVRSTTRSGARRGP